MKNKKLIICVVFLLSITNIVLADPFDSEDFGVYADLDETEWGNWSENWTISTSHTCESTGYLYGNWSESDHFIITPGRPDEDWTYANSTHWDVVDNGAWWRGNYTFDVTCDMNHTFAVLNNSGMNRSQSFGWVHVNDTEVSPVRVFPYIIFAYNGSTDYDLVMWTGLEAYILHWNGTNMTDIGDTVPDQPVVDPVTDATDISDQWEADGYLTDEGNYYKLIYNEHTGQVWFKWWGPVPMSEPPGWTIQFQDDELIHEDARCYGVGVWNPNQIATAHVQFDLLNVWQLNYTVNSSDYCNISAYNESRPHMDFPIINLGTWTEEIMAYFNGSELGNLSADDVRSIMKDNLTNLMNVESRMYELKNPSGYRQNDTIYYYSCTIDNFTAFSEESFDDWIHIHIQHCPERNISTEYGDLMIGIDVDNDREWDINDRVYWAYLDDEGDLFFETYNGNGYVIDNLSQASIWSTESSAVGNLHRYESHLNYALTIPLADLIKEDETPLNSTDIFGLSILTTMDENWFDNATVWQNWNETSGDPYYTETGYTPPDGGQAVIAYFFNQTGPEGYGANTTNLQRWGEGEIGPGLEADEEVSYSVNITKTANVSSIDEAGTTYALINYSIWVNNTGSLDLTNVVVNDTLWNCSCSGHHFYEAEFNDTNISWDSITNGTCWREFNITTIAGGESWHIWYVVNMSLCDGYSHGTLLNTAVVNATELTGSSSDTHSISWDARADSHGISITADWTSLITFVIVLLIISFMAAAIGHAKISK